MRRQQAIVIGIVLQWILSAVPGYGQWQYVGTEFRGINARSDTVHIVGTRGIIMRSIDGGSTWTLPHSGTTSNLGSVGFFDSRNGLITGADTTMLRTSDGGLHWQRVTPFDSVGFSIHCVSEKLGYAVTGDGRIFRTDDAGTSWRRASSLGSDISVKRGMVINASRGFVIVDGGRIFRTTDSARTWQEVFTDPTVTITGIDFADTLNGIAVGAYARLYRTWDGGTSWKRLADLDPGIRASQVAMLDTNTILVTGAFGSGDESFLLGRSTNGGENWEYSIPLPTSKLTFLNVILKVDSQRVIIIGDLGIIIASDNRGATWRTISSTQIMLPPNMPVAAQPVTVVSDSVMMIPLRWDGIGIWVRSTDRGVTWEYRAQSFIDKFISSRFFDPLNGVALPAGGGYLCRSTDGGLSWTKETVNFTPRHRSTLAVTWVDRNTAYLGGDSLVYRTTDGGMTWTGVEIEDAQIVSRVQVVTPDLLFCLGQALDPQTIEQLYALHRSTDGGRTWQRILSRRGASEAINDIFFHDIDHGFVAGQGKPGAILRTSDAGKTWDTIRTQPGAINKIEFFSPDRGIAVGGRMTIYETTDGGRTWVPSLPFATVDSNATLFSVALLPDRRTMIASGTGIIIRRVYENSLTGTRWEPVYAHGNRRMELSIAPNPISDGSFTIYLGGVGDVEFLDVYNSLGRRLAHLAPGQTQDSEVIVARLPDLPNGIYHIVAHGRNGTAVGQFVVAR